MKMTKIFAMAALSMGVVAAMSSCSGNGDKATEDQDSVEVAVDSEQVDVIAVDGDSAQVVAEGVVEEITATPVEQAQEAADKASGKIDKAKEAVNTALDKAGDKANAALDKAGDKANAALNKAKTAVDDAASKYNK